MNESALLAVLNDLEREALTSIVSFVDGDVYRLRIVSTMHAEEGDDIVAEVVSHPHSAASQVVTEGGLINFKMADVDRVMLDQTGIFRRRA